ncbi:MAG: hypothetical protein PHI58_06680 [Candidatus Omnitrophica bacterium]|nr:hypothetical protein [Candidatus Omnitrophota bacterium]
MKCQFCGKHIDEVDCSCGWCTICGWSFDVKTFAAAKDNKENK